VSVPPTIGGTDTLLDWRLPSQLPTVTLHRPLGLQPIGNRVRPEAREQFARQGPALAAMLEEHGRNHERALATATASRCQSLVLAARGDLKQAAAAIDQALAAHARLEMPFELARTLLVNGLLERRARRKRCARDCFEQALSIFNQLGAKLWAERARAELDRSYRRRSSPGELTPTEQRIAELAAAGLTNRAIAERVFLSPKTVEANLARVYRKLGIRSRAPLGQAMAKRDRFETK